MKCSILFFCCITVVCNLTYGKILRVGYTGIPLAGVDFSGFDLAYNAASPGDTIQIYGSFLVPNFTISKRIVIQGFGYNFDVNSNLQTTSLDAPSQITGTIGSLLFDVGSENSVIEGCTDVCSGVITIATSDITV